MKNIIEITSIEELLEMSTAGAVTGYAVPSAPKKKEEDCMMREEVQTEALLRQHI